MILDAQAIAERMTTPATDPRAYLLAFYPDLADRIPPLAHVVATARPMVAYVNSGIWKAKCECGARGVPSPGCVVWLAIPLGWCVRCGNQGTGRGWRPIIVPPADLRADIAEILLFRPNQGDWNWEPSESIDDLIRQNIEHGDPISEAA